MLDGYHGDGIGVLAAVCAAGLGTLVSDLVILIFSRSAGVGIYVRTADFFDWHTLRANFLAALQIR